jgi:hypothetical protein
MHTIDPGAFFEGAVSIESCADGFRPWRLPHTQAALFPSPGDALLGAARKPSAVRLRFRTDSPTVLLRVAPLGKHGGDSPDSRFDLTLDNAIVRTVEAVPGAEEIAFRDLPPGDRILELWLPPGVDVLVRELRIEEGASCTPSPDPRPRWVTYGSSLTHCVRAKSAARVWPAIVARARNLHVTSLGFGGQCHMDPLVGMVIRDLPADLITLKLGINMAGNGSFNLRSFAPAMIGLIRTIREKHPLTPIGLVTSFCCPPRETTPNAAGMTLEIMREQTRDVYTRLVSMGDRHLHLCDGLNIVDAEAIARYTADQCHHNGEGIEEIATRWLTEVMERVAPAPV